MTYGVTTMQKLLKCTKIMSLEVPHHFRNFYLLLISTYVVINNNIYPQYKFNVFSNSIQASQWKFIEFEFNIIFFYRLLCDHCCFVTRSACLLLTTSKNYLNSSCESGTRRCFFYSPLAKARMFFLILCYTRLLSYFLSSLSYLLYVFNPQLEPAWVRGVSCNHYCSVHFAGV